MIFSNQMERKNLTTREKFIVRGQQNQRCNICKEPLDAFPQFDHIRALHQGGSNDMNNFQALCTTCHAEKTRKERRRKRSRFFEVYLTESEMFDVVAEQDNQCADCGEVLTTIPEFINRDAWCRKCARERERPPSPPPEYEGPPPDWVTHIRSFMYKLP